MSTQSDVSLLGKIASYTEILAKDPSSTVFVPLSETYRKMGLLDDALEVVENGIRALPAFSPGYTALGRIHAQRGAFEEAAAAFGKALGRDENSVAALKGLARVRMKTGDAETAQKLLERVVSLRPDDETAKKMLVSFGERMPTAERATAAEAAGDPPTENIPRGAERSVRAGGPISTPTIAELYIRQGFPKRALKVYRDLLQEDPHNEEIRRKLVDLKRQIEVEESPDREPSVKESAAENAIAGPETDSTSESASRDAGRIAVFERWLDAIRQRREHVQ